MNTYQAFYRYERIEVQAESSYKAQLIAAAKFKTRKASDVTIILQAIRLPLIAFHDDATEADGQPEPVSTK